MISFLKGIVVDLPPGMAVLDVNGIGFSVEVSAVTSADLAPAQAEGKPVHLHTHLIQKENGMSFYGFATPEEKVWFRLLIEHVEGVGGKTALVLLGQLGIPTLQKAIAGKDAKTISGAKGIGLKTANRIILELSDKLDLSKLGSPAMGAATVVEDAVLALVSLGYKQAAARHAVEACATAGVAATADLVRRALGSLAR